MINLLKQFRRNSAKTESVLAVGTVTYTLRDKDGNVKEIRTVKNLITNAGFDFLCNVVGGTQPAAMQYVGIGTGTNAANVTDTTLQTQVFRKIGTFAHTTGTKSYSLDVIFNIGEGTGAITEAGTFNATSAGTMLNRQVFATINKSATDSLEVVWLITFS